MRKVFAAACLALALGGCAQLQALGFAAKVEERVDTEPAYWVDYTLPAGGTFDWRAWLPGRSDLKSNPIDCF